MSAVDLVRVGSELLAAEESQTTPLITLGLPLLAVALSPLTAWLTFEFVRKRELAETMRHELTRDTELATQAEARSRRETVRRETLKWTTPILMSTDELNSRLGNLLEGGAYPALDANWRRPEAWSMSHGYLYSSTLYLFSAYFSYVELLRRSLNFELFRSQEDKNLLFHGLDAVASTLASYPAPWSSGGRDAQVFRLQQRAIGELMFVDGVDGPTCLTLADFTERLAEDRFLRQLAPLRELIDGLAPVQGDCRWQRLAATRQALTALSGTCRQLLAAVAD
ncbi:hypothetical protein I0C86_19520 [Plantactinospora sp. S1510]|uniref:Uncharacterized protein n=1 Tax=Plantactinospora alkalitolerans TaxID=2789879 RepID=A0ABS0GY49_9ACTN|nr:hypothetical protein [Plantactinospora alkalitolerans]MBF9131132.1 hypothetical protein [Plantactinospora alkalitolerans]